jgi:uncharacterized protein YndB with AHSA1/START domain
MGREYVFSDEWEVEAPILAVFRALADATTYPVWWASVYRAVEADGPLRVGRVARERVKGRLFYELAVTSEILRLEPPREYELLVAGDVSAHGLWTLAPLPRGAVQVRLDWRLDATPATLRLLAPLLRRWDHRWAIRHAIAGLEPYARASAASGSASAVSST